jgi:hypothetical protein
VIIWRASNLFTKSIVVDDGGDVEVAGGKVSVTQLVKVVKMKENDAREGADKANEQMINKKKRSLAKSNDKKHRK